MHLRILLRQRPTSWLEMVVAFNWAWHVGACWDTKVARLKRRAGTEQVELVKSQLGLCHEKCQILMLAVSEDAHDSSSVSQGTAQRLELSCTRAMDLRVVMKLAVQESDRLLNALSNPGLVDSNGGSAAHLAVERQALPMLKALTSYNPTLFDATDKRGWTLLHSAVFGVSVTHPSPSLDTVRWIVKKRPELLRVVDHGGAPPIVRALESSTLACIQFLGQHSPELLLHRFGTDFALHRAALNPDAENVGRYVFAAAPSLVVQVNAVGQNALHVAACRITFAALPIVGFRHL